MGATCIIWTPLNPRPWGWLLPSLVKIQPCISSRSRWTVTFYIGPPSPTCTYPPMGAIGATLGTATNNLYSLPKKVSTLYITWLFYLNWIWRRSLKFAQFWPFGALPLGPHRNHMYHMNNFESPAPKDDSCHVWLKSDHAFFKKKTFYKGPPPQPVTLRRGPLGPPWELPWTTFILHPNKVSTHNITWLFSVWIWRRCLKFAWFWHFGALPLGPHGGHTYYLNNFESPTPKDDSCQVWLKSNHAFSRRRWICKKFTNDGRKRTAIAHWSLRLRWANKNSYMYTIVILWTL